MQISRIRNQEEFNNYSDKNIIRSNFIHEFENKLSAGKGKEFTIRGFSYPAKDMVDFRVDHAFSDGININWRERVVCPISGLNNRLRACIHFIDFELGLRDDNDIYIAEQVTPLYAYLKNIFPNIIGSEYLGHGYQPGSMNGKKLRHEDAANLSFNHEALDCYISFECLEHIPDFEKAFSEAFRVLKTKGKFFWSVPFAKFKYENIIRSFEDSNGHIQHILEPEYHGDPVSSNGILCFTHFGWKMLDQMKYVGFKDAYALIYWSDIFGYLGGDQILFIAEK